MNTIQTSQLYSEDSCGTYGEFHIDITVGATKLPDLKTEAVRGATYDAVKVIKSAIMEAVIRANPEAMKRAVDEKVALLALFPGKPFVEEIPNGYCSDYCCKHLPWFLVTTEVGRVKIGWRKRVILIDWSDTRNTKTSDELFQAEDVTKGTRMIHAWSIQDAGRYINVILASNVK